MTPPVPLTSYLFPEALGREAMAGSPWPPFCPPEPYGPFGLMVCSECGSRERNFLSMAPWG